MSENDLRHARAARNEALFREVNKQLAALRETFDPQSETATFVCECARTDCAERIEMTLAEYAAVRENPRRFFVARADGHRFPKIERLIATRGRYFVVEKTGSAAKIAEQTATR